MSKERGRILVVDDNEANRDMLSRRLGRRGHGVLACDSGAVALDRIEKEEFDVVLLDIMMPGMSGPDTLRAIREKHNPAELPIIMVTARTESESVVESLNLGANDYVTKPIDFPVLEARLQTQLRIRRLSELKDEFLRIASHDLRNPLSMILTTSSTLPRVCPAGEPMSEQARDLLGRIEARAREMQRIIEDFLDFQAMSDGQVHLRRAPVDLNSIAEEVVAGNRDYARSKDIELEFVPSQSLPATAADPARVMQVAHNLVGNAVKFSPGQTRVIVRTARQDSFVRMEVIDSGPGLSDEDMGKLFTKYAKLANKPTGGEKSSGLGLAICKEMIDLHGGQIGAWKNPDRGLTFWFNLPAE
jgi:two-component system sensor histidine kinase/response regulator